MDTAAMVTVMMAGPMITAIVIGANTMKISAQWRERRAARAATR